MGLLLGDILVRAAWQSTDPPAHIRTRYHKEEFVPVSCSTSRMGQRPFASGRQCRRSAPIAARSVHGISRSDSVLLSYTPSRALQSLMCSCWRVARKGESKLIPEAWQDRVEASPEQMARCSAIAESFSNKTGTLTRVVGWYHRCRTTAYQLQCRSQHLGLAWHIQSCSLSAHQLTFQASPSSLCATVCSHPHITVLPSHVDVRTQAMYQMLDQGFVGLIFSAFNEVRCCPPQRVELACMTWMDRSC